MRTSSSMTCIDNGYQILIASMRNTVQAQLGLFEKANCKVIVSCHSLDQSLQPLFTASGVRQVQAPTLDDILDNQSVPHYEYKKSPDKNVLMIVHTSGSSGKIHLYLAGKKALIKYRQPKTNILHPRYHQIL